MKSNIAAFTKKSSREVGFIAQDVEQLFPDLVDTRDNGYKGLKYARFVPIITEGMKELRNRGIASWK